MLRTLLRSLRPNRKEAAEALLAARGAGVATFREAMPACAAETRRARRYERPLAMLAITPEPLVGLDHGGQGGPHEALSTHLSFFLLGSLLRETMREPDIVAYSVEHALYVVLLPESGATEVRGAVRRISGVTQEHMKLRVRAGVAEFPKDGLTVQSLFENARQACAPQLFVERLPLAKEASRA